MKCLISCTVPYHEYPCHLAYSFFCLYICDAQLKSWKHRYTFSYKLDIILLNNLRVVWTVFWAFSIKTRRCLVTHQSTDSFVIYIFSNSTYRYIQTLGQILQNLCTRNPFFLSSITLDPDKMFLGKLNGAASISDTP